MNIRKNSMSDGELDKVSGGNASGSGYILTVGNCNGAYLALQPQPVWDRANELAQLYPGYQVFTYGATRKGTGLSGVPCNYTYVRWNDKWGWANSSFLHY
ncbi:MAG: hypothetical protein IJH09_13265 [Clostridia bacterium]|nr:hypothetical protein [Clostridia bacterium]